MGGKCAVVFFISLSMGWVNTPLVAQTRTDNLIIVVLDGFRWKELYRGADSRILNNSRFVTDTAMKETFWDPSVAERRKLLMPFLWSTVVREGQLYGNRSLKSRVNCANQHRFSYPGYSELLVGFIEPKVRSNDKIKNPNYTVLEFIARYPGFAGKVAAVGGWDVFPYVFREETSGIPVISGEEIDTVSLGKMVRDYPGLAAWLTDTTIAQPDARVFWGAFHYLKSKRPRVMFIGFKGTDRYAHQGRYDVYLKTARLIDEMLNALWQWIQEEDDYRNRTTLLVTTDHGRGVGVRRGWRKHGFHYIGSRHIWIAVIGPDTPPRGEMGRGTYYQKQIAKTLAAFLGIDYTQRVPVGDVIRPAIGR